jgi:hypothetical protein
MSESVKVLGWIAHKAFNSAIAMAAIRIQERERERERERVIKLVVSVIYFFHILDGFIDFGLWV